VLLNVASLVTVEAHLAKGLGDGGSNSGSGTGLANSSDIGMDLVGAGGSVKVDGVNVLGSGMKGFCTTLKGVLLLAGKHVGAMLVVVLICTVMCTVVEVVEAEGMLPRVRLGVEC
jgi:hypothetical protein